MDKTATATLLRMVCNNFISWLFVDVVYLNSCSLFGKATTKIFPHPHANRTYAAFSRHRPRWSPILGANAAFNHSSITCSFVFSQHQLSHALGPVRDVWAFRATSNADTRSQGDSSSLLGSNTRTPFLCGNLCEFGWPWPRDRLFGPCQQLPQFWQKKEVLSLAIYADLFMLNGV